MTKTFCDRCNEEIKEDSIWVFEQELCPKCAKELREQFSKSSMRVNSDNCEDKSNGATDREIELQQIIQNQKIYIAQLKAEICDSSEQLENLTNIIEQVDDGKMTWQEAIDSLVQKYRRSDQ